MAITHPIIPRKSIHTKGLGMKFNNKVRAASNAAANVKLLIWPISIISRRDHRHPIRKPKPYMVGISPTLVKDAPIRLASNTIVGPIIPLANCNTATLRIIAARDNMIWIKRCSTFRHQNLRLRLSWLWSQIKSYSMLIANKVKMQI